MKKYVVLLIALSIASCNGQKNKKDNLVTKKNSEIKKVNSDKIINLTDIKFKTNIENLLGTYNLTLDDNASNEYNVSGDYEEFRLESQNISFFDEEISSKNSKLSFFYTKIDKILWCYELEVSNNNVIENIIKKFESKYGKTPAFSKVSINTKEHPIFLDENGEQEKDHMEERILVWEDIQNKTTFFVIYKVNYSKKPIDNNIQIIAIDKNNKKYKEWISYRSLNMYYKK